MFANVIPSGVDEGVIALNALLSGGAFGFNLVVALRSAKWGRIVHGAIASLAVGYVCSYVLLLATDVAVANWSSVMRGVSLVAWLVVWTGPAYLRLRSNIPDRFAAEVQRQLEAL